MPMRRRDILQSGIAAAATAFVPGPQARAAPFARVRPGMDGWPSEADWAELRGRLGGRLLALDVFQRENPADPAQSRNPYYRRDRPDLTQSTGWIDAWRSTPPAYVVAAESAADVAAAVRFAAERRLRVAIRGGGHSYLGTSCAPDSLLIWMRRMDRITVHPAFVPDGSGAAPVPAVSLGSGCVWLHAYQAVTGGAGRYVQGGGCTTVGVSGHMLGGGFGSFSKAYGLAAASLLEAEIVTADGAVRVVNAARDPDLFWALKGGGGGTFGVVTRLTLATHPLPDTFGILTLRLHARSDAAYKRLIARFMSLYAERMFNPHWGEQARFGPDNALRLLLLFQGIDKAQARSAIEPLLAFAGSTDIDGVDTLSISALPARFFWNAWLLRLFARSAVEFDSRPGASWTDFWWTGDADQSGAFWHGYESAWLPATLLDENNRMSLVDALFAASRHWSLALHFNKGLAGAPSDRLAAARDTAINPDVLSAFALAISAMSSPTAPREGSGDADAARKHAARVSAAMAALRTVAPESGAYLNECSFFQDDWQRRFWGPHYARLLEIKNRVDPDGLFVVHHGVGSEVWSADGFSRSP